MKYCQNCGTSLPDGANVCPNCGTPVNGKANAQTTNAARPIVENRSIATCIILSIVTCGIYGIIWFVNMVNDVNRVCNDEKSSTSGGTVFLLSLVTCGIYSIVWFYQVGQRLHKAGQKYNLEIADNSIVYLLLCIFGLGIVNYCLVQSDLNKFSN